MKVEPRPEPQQNPGCGLSPNGIPVDVGEDGPYEEVFTSMQLVFGEVADAPGTLGVQKEPKAEVGRPAPSRDWATSLCRVCGITVAFLGLGPRACPLHEL